MLVYLVLEPNQITVCTPCRCGLFDSWFSSGIMPMVSLNQNTSVATTWHIRVDNIELALELSKVPVVKVGLVGRTWTTLQKNKVREKTCKCLEEPCMPLATYSQASTLNTVNTLSARDWKSNAFEQRLFLESSTQQSCRIILQLALCECTVLFHSVLDWEGAWGWAVLLDGSLHVFMERYPLHPANVQSTSPWRVWS